MSESPIAAFYRAIERLSPEERKRPLLIFECVLLAHAGRQNPHTRKLYSLLLKAAEDFVTKGWPKDLEVDAMTLIDRVNETKDEVQREVHRLVSTRGGRKGGSKRSTAPPDRFRHELAKLTGTAREKGIALAAILGGKPESHERHIRRLKHT